MYTREAIISPGLSPRTLKRRRVSCPGRNSKGPAPLCATCSRTSRRGPPRSTRGRAIACKTVSRSKLELMRRFAALSREIRSRSASFSPLSRQSPAHSPRFPRLNLFLPKVRRWREAAMPWDEARSEAVNRIANMAIIHHLITFQTKNSHSFHKNFLKIQNIHADRAMTDFHTLQRSSTKSTLQ